MFTNQTVGSATRMVVSPFTCQCLCSREESTALVLEAPNRIALMLLQSLLTVVRRSRPNLPADISFIVLALLSDSLGGSWFVIPPSATPVGLGPSATGINGHDGLFFSVLKGRTPELRRHWLPNHFPNFSMTAAASEVG